MVARTQWLVRPQVRRTTLTPHRVLSLLVRHAFHVLCVRPLVTLLLGVGVRHPERLPNHGPAMLVANHNSHLDALVLAALLPLSLLHLVRPVAAAGYFSRNRLLSWFATDVVGILPIDREGPGTVEEKLRPCSKALRDGSILIFFPEGTRGDPERLSQFKSGVFHLVERHPEIPVIPVFLQGLGKALPKGEGILVPFVCNANVGNPLPSHLDKTQFMHTLQEEMAGLAGEGNYPPWE